MNVILLEKIGKLGTVGDTASVKAGYARNYLFPTGKAIPATKANVEQFEERRAELMAVHNKKVAEAQARADKLKDLTVTIEANAGEEGKLFGSVGTADIAEAVSAATGEEFQKSEVRLPIGTIREIGDYEITMDVGFDVEQDIVVSVVPVRQGETA